MFPDGHSLRPKDLPAMTSLTDVLIGDEIDDLRQLQSLLATDVFRRQDDLTMAQRSRAAYDQLRILGRHLGPTRAVSANLPLLFAVFEAAAVQAPDVFPLLSGHYNLAVPAIVRAAARQPDLEGYLAELDALESVGVLLLTELGYGSNVDRMRTEAVHDPDRHEFVLRTPDAEAVKWMPNVAAELPRLVVVAARLIVGGVDRGVLPFLVRLRGADGEPAAGVRITRMPEKSFLPMDNAMISFDDVRLPATHLLAGDVATVTPDGTFSSSVPSRHGRYRHTIEVLQTGRVALSSGVLAAARAGLRITFRYAEQRLVSAPHHGRVPMLRYRNVQRSLLVPLARVYAATLLARHTKRVFAGRESDPLPVALLAMIAKPMLSWTARDALAECRERCGAQGMFAINRIGDYLGLCHGVVTAEGENQVLQITAGARLLTGDHRPTPPSSPPAPVGEPAGWRDLLAARERMIWQVARDGLHRPGPAGETSFDRWNGQVVAAAAVADAAAHRIALAQLLDAANTAGGPTGALLRQVTEVYVLDQLDRHAAWYVGHGLLSASDAAGLDDALSAACARLVPEVDTLTGAFGVPDDELGAPAGSPDYVAAWSKLHDGRP